MPEEESRKTKQGLSRRGFVAGAGAMSWSLAAPRMGYATPSDVALALAEKRRPELQELLSSMIRIKSLSGESAADAQEVVKAYLSDLPYSVSESADRPSRYERHAEYMHPSPAGDGPFINVIGRPQNASERQYAMFSHIDTHSMDEGWNTDPLKPVIEGNRMVGLGTSDDKGGVAAMLVAAAALAEAGEELPVVMSLHGKGGGSRGSLPVFDRLSKTAHGIAAVLYVHPAETGRGLEDIKNAVQGILDLELAIAGWRGPQMEIGSVDSANWDEGGNAIIMLGEALEHLQKTAFADVMVNIGIVNGGSRIGSVADEARAKLRLKFNGDHTWKSLLQTAEQELSSFEQGLPQMGQRFVMNIKPVGYRTNPGAADWNAPVSRILRDSIEDVTGKAPNAYPNHYAGDIRYPIRLLGVPAYGIGSLGGNFYGPNEWVDMDDLVKLVAVLIQTLSGWSEL